MFKEYLKNNQTVIYQILQNAFKNHHESHAYLLYGEKGTDLIGLAKFIAQSFLCKQDDVLACETCETCKRISENNYFDVHFIDGSNESIKDNMVKELKKELTLSSLENGKSIYIINLIENATLKTVNSLLKFLEEPSDDVVAIITTNNMSKVLPTIISRCQLLRFKTPNKQELIDKLISLGVNKEDAFIATSYASSIDDVNDLLKNNRFNVVKECAYSFYDVLIGDKQRVAFFMQNDVSKKLGNSREELSLFLDILQDIIKDYYREEKIFSISDDIIFDLYDIYKLLEIINIYQGKLSVNVNTGLLLDSLSYRIMEVFK